MFSHKDEKFITNLAGLCLLKCKPFLPICKSVILSFIIADIFKLASFPLNFTRVNCALPSSYLHVGQEMIMVQSGTSDSKNLFKFNYLISIFSECSLLASFVPAIMVDGFFCSSVTA